MKHIGSYTLDGRTYQMNAIAAQALDLHSRICQRYYAEAGKQDWTGRSTANAALLTRLERAKQRAADLWRRQMGYESIYEGAPR